MSSENEVHIREIGRTGRITLTRPKALNALTYDMALAIEAALDRWQESGAVDLVLIDGEGERAFCAGGDIADLYNRGRVGDFAFGRDFWTDEYRLNAKIANCRIPYIAIMDGFVMGGGVGISVHGTHRVVTERSRVAMPECAIGIVPDVGGNRFLANAPGHLGEFLAMSGWKMNAADAIAAGFADIEVPSHRLQELKETIEKTADPAVAGQFAVAPRPGPLDMQRDVIDRHFAHATAIDCLHSLESDASDFAVETAATIRRGCPLSVACAFEIVRRARKLKTIEDVLALEYRFTWRSMSDGDFVEGIRAQIIEKDRNPRWKFKRLEDVRAEDVAAMIASLGPNELKFRREERV